MSRRVFSSGAAKQVREATQNPTAGPWKRRGPSTNNTITTAADKKMPMSQPPASNKKPLGPTLTSHTHKHTHYNYKNHTTIDRKPAVVLPRVNRHAATSTTFTHTHTQTFTLTRPSFHDLRLLALQRGVPFIGFGLIDNAIMIVSGDYIEMSIGLSLGIGTMTAAALGNIIADVIGLNLGGMIEEASHRMGIPEPNLSAGQRELTVVKMVTYAGSSLGIAFGCLLGMIPLLFMNSEGEREESPAEVLEMLAGRVVGLVGCERVCVFQVDGDGKVVGQYCSPLPTAGGVGGNGGGKGGLPVILAQDVVEQVWESKEGLKMWNASVCGYKGEEEREEEGDGGAIEAVGTKQQAQQQQQQQPRRRLFPFLWQQLQQEQQQQQQQQAQPQQATNPVESLLCLPVLDKDGKVLAIVAAVNALPSPPSSSSTSPSPSPSPHDFATEDHKTLAGLCTQAAEALINMTRRPEEHVSLKENLKLLSTHSSLPLHEYRPSLRALIYGQDGTEGLRLRTESVPIVVEGVGERGGRNTGKGAQGTVAATGA